MKIQAFLKIAVVATAALAAYAFSGNNGNSQSQFYTYDASSKKCKDIVTAGCKGTGSYTCRININNQTMPLYDLVCENPILHDDPEPLNDWSR